MDRSLAIWLKHEDDEESEVARWMFSAATHMRTSRTVRTQHELFDKIMIFDDGLDDFEIELFKFATCIRQQLDFSAPFYYAGLRAPLLGRKSIDFLVADGDELRPMQISMNDYTSATKPMAAIAQPLLDDATLDWVHLDRTFILRLLENSGVMQQVTPSATAQDTIQVHTLGRPPEFDDYDGLDNWLSSGSNTYKLGTWHIGEDLSADQAAKHQDMQTGDLYVIYQMVKEDWKAFFVSRQRFEQLKALEESM